MMFGGIAVSALDYDLAPYVGMSFKKHFKTGLEYLESKTKEEIKDIMSEFTVEIEGKEIMDEFSAVYNYAYDMTKDETYQASEALMHNLNTLQSRAGKMIA